VTAGRGAGDVTEWLRSLERPLLNTMPFLDKEQDKEQH
jgi:hypothetical protein